MNTKYKLVALRADGLCRIQALKDIRDDVRTGDLGGWIADESCLDHTDDSWVYDESAVQAGSRVEGRSAIRSHALIMGGSRVESGSLVESSILRQHSRVIDRSVVCGHSLLSGTIVADMSIFKNSSRGIGSVVRGSSLVEDGVLVFARIDEATLVSRSTICNSRISASNIISGFIQNREMHGMAITGGWEGTHDNEEVD